MNDVTGGGTLSAMTRPRPAAAASFLAPLLLAPLLLPLTGCGSAASYEADLVENTVEYFELRQRLDAALNGPSSSAGITLRVPKGFARVRAPEPLTEEEIEAGAEEPEDERQTGYLPFDMPGLRLAWRARPRPGASPGQRWIYVFDTRRLEDDPVNPALDPEELFFDVADRFAEGLDRPQPDLDNLTRQVYPTPAERFAEEVTYDVLPAPLVGEIDGVEHQIEFYALRTGRRETIVTLVYPAEDLRDDAALQAARDLMLQTLRVRRPAPTAAPEPGTGTPAGDAGF